jgi:hypothetical protein
MIDWNTLKKNANAINLFSSDFFVIPCFPLSVHTPWAY